MPFMGRNNQPLPSKRRWHEDDSPFLAVYCHDNEAEYFSLTQSPHAASRKMLPLSKRAKIGGDEEQRSIHNSLIVPTHHRRRSSQQRILLDLTDLKSKASERPATLNLSPCHICHRRPTKKSNLDSFAECQGCRQQTCFICIRECQGTNADEGASVLSEQEVLSRSFHMEDADGYLSYMVEDEKQRDDKDERYNNNNITTNNNNNNNNSLSYHSNHINSQMHTHDDEHTKRFRKGWAACGHRKVVCSRCCVERGAEGEVVCLGCLSGLDVT